ncbi:MAG: glycosyltransferase family 2 protein [Calditrichaeota bacterium]|nr:glycosyltransferase family 2 protein [Calditrichota bacterium]
MSDFSAKLSAIIVTFNNASALQATLSSLVENVSFRPLEIILIDNRSTDETLDIIRSFARKASTKDVRILFRLNKKNRGFTHAVNQGLRHATGELILFLNPDVQLAKNSVEQMVELLTVQPDVGIVAPQLLFPNGRIQPSCRHFPRYRDVIFELTGLSRLFSRSKFFNYWKMGYFPHNRIRRVDQPQGACLLTTRSIVNRIGPWDERFFLFFSDVDWCRRVKRIRKKIYFYPEAKAIHKKGDSVYRHRIKSLFYSHRDFIKYFWKYNRKVWQFPFNLGMTLLLLIAGAIRIMLALPGTLFRNRKN